MSVVSLVGYRPSPRYDDLPWTDVRIEEAEEGTGPWTGIETIPLDPLDADPEQPAFRNFTTAAATLQSGWYRAVFLDAALNEDTTDPVQYPAPGYGYPTTTELAGASSLDALTSLPLDEQATLRLAAIYAVEEYTGQPFTYETGVTRFVDGTGHRKIYLPVRLEALTTLTVEDSALSEDDVVVTEKGDALVVNPDAGISNYYVRAMMEVQGWPSMTFVSGVENVTINGDWGWATFPEAVATALRLDMEDMALADTHTLSETIRAFRGLGLRDVSQGNLRADVSAAPALSPRVIRLLDPFVWSGPVGATV